MSAKKRALGRGLDALLGSEPPATALAEPPAASDQGVRNLPFVRLKANPFQPRHHFDETAIEELTASVKANGILQPIIVRKAKEGDDFEIVAGERRWRAAQRAGLAEVPVVVREYSDREMLELSLLENLQRADLNAVEEARAYQQLIDAFHLTQDQVAVKIGKSRVAITNALRLLRLPQTILDWIVEGALTAGHARALLSLGGEASQLAVAREILTKGLSVRETERRIRQLFNSAKKSAEQENAAPAEPKVSETAPWEEKLTQKLGRKVHIAAQTNNQGRIEIYYASLDEFQAILEQLGIPVEQEI